MHSQVYILESFFTGEGGIQGENQTSLVEGGVDYRTLSSLLDSEFEGPREPPRVCLHIEDNVDLEFQREIIHRDLLSPSCTISIKDRVPT